MFAGHGSVLSWVFGVGALAIVVLGYLASINGTPGCDEASCYLSRLPRRVKNDDVASAVEKHKDTQTGHGIRCLRSAILAGGYLHAS